MRSSNRGLTLTLVAGCIASLLFVGAGTRNTPKAPPVGLVRFAIPLLYTPVFGSNSGGFQGLDRSITIDPRADNPLAEVASLLRVSPLRVVVTYPGDSCPQARTLYIDQQAAGGRSTRWSDGTFFELNNKCDGSDVSPEVFSIDRALDPVVRNHWIADSENPLRYTAHSGAVSATLADNLLRLEFSTGVAYEFSPVKPN